MNQQLREIVEWLGRLYLEQGVISFQALLSDGETLSGDLVFGLNDSTLTLSHSRLGIVVLTNDRVRWHPPSGPGEEYASDNRTALGALRTGFLPQYAWVAHALQLARLPNAVVPLSRLTDRRSTFRVSEMSLLTVPWGPATLGPVSLPRSTGTLAIRQTYFDLSSGAIDLSFVIVGANGETDLAGC